MGSNLVYNMMLMLELLLLCLASVASGALFGQCGSLSSSCDSNTTASSTEYVGLTAAEKMQLLWSKCLESRTPADWFTTKQLMGMFLESMCPTFQAQGDQLPWEKRLLSYGWRNKYIHTVGTVGQVEWRDLGSHPYTGIFQGATQGIVRFSFAKEPSNTSISISPDMGLKFLRDGKDSANLVAMYSVNGQESWNFFKNDFTNHIGTAGPELVPLAVKFSTATTNIHQVGLSDFARFGETGSEVVDPQFPFMLRFHPTGDIAFSDQYVRPFTEDLKSIPQGSTLYEVWALDQPVELGGTEKHIADLVLVSEMTTSLWGDKHLYFRHQFMDEDVAIRPEWEEYLDKFGIEGPPGCPLHKLRRLGRLGDN